MMRTLALLFVLTPSLSAAPPGAPEREAFERSIRPLLVKSCFACHSREAKKQRGGLNLDSRAALLRGGDTGPAVVPGDPAKSLLIQAVRYDHGSLHMPPAGKLPAREVALLEEWVRRGAVFPGPEDGPPVQQGIDLVRGRQFWSFQPLVSHPLPPGDNVGWARTRIDRFILGELSKRFWKPAPEANRRTLVRRLSFDLIGLPPTPEEVEAFVQDNRLDAYERLVDRLLASPAHGERWGRFWLDLVRYADVTEEWATYKGAPYLYRDWVIAAFNRDEGYDRFVQLQLAADQTPQAPIQDRAALGMLGLSPDYWKELKLDPMVIQTIVAEEWEERIHTLGSTFLGLTVACARCHDHKFDPITTQDYYGLAGVLASSRVLDIPVGANVPAAGLVEESQFVEPDGPHRTRVIYKPGPRDVRVQIRGNPATPGPVVPRRFLSVLARQSKTFQQGSGRLELARSLVEDSEALLARVMVNRVWKHHFGEGIVRTVSDFGSQGERPTHPALLDDLARRFVEAGWSLKWLHREIVGSAVYRQSSVTEASALANDPDNRWLARASRRRLEVEAWRDAMLAVTGTLRQQLTGPPVDLNQNTDRRTVYGSLKRREPVELMRLHDAPDASTHSPARLATTTPLQQLFVLNSPLMHLQSAALAQRLQIEASDQAGRIDRAYRLLFGRPPRPAEVLLGEQYLATAPWPEYAQVLLASNEFLFLD